jgi:hypothetical protein
MLPSSPLILLLPPPVLLPPVVLLLLPQSVFLDYLAALISHESVITGLPLREDPVVLGWQLAEGLHHPGQIASDALLVSK